MKVAIAGYGIEGRSSFAYWYKKGDEVTILDERNLSAQELPYSARAFTGKGAFNHLKDFDVVVRSPSIHPKRLKKARKLTSATQEFLERCPAPIIGITGTKGKGTTASLIYAILKASGKTTWLVGNIGTPSLDILSNITPDDVVVYEMSSFQLWDASLSPHIAVVLAIEPDHLDVHDNFANYVNAKANITLHQKETDTLVFNDLNDTSTHIAIQSVATKVPYPNDTFVHVKDGYFYYNEQKLCSISSLILPGNHNVENACAAIAAAWEYVQDAETIKNGLGSFSGLPHRLKHVRDIADVSYYDDSIATTPGSAIAAIQAFERPKVLILGGSDKGADYKPLIAEIAKSETMRAVICIGANGEKLAKLLKKAGAVYGLNYEASKDMTTIVKRAAACAQPGDVVIMSPAAASFDMFKSYADRGEQFVAAVEEL